MIKNAILGTAVVLGALTSCNNAKSVGVDNEHTAQNSLDWNGTYSGVLPCADCEGIETELTINSDKTYILTTTYLGEDSQPEVKKGTFKWEGNNIRLSGIKKEEGSDLYKVEENKIKHLTLEGKEVKGDLANHYVLSKNGNATVENKRWKLIEIFGKKVDGNADTHYVIFHSEDNRIEAKAGCNVLSIPYKIKHEFRLELGEGAGTLMACQNEELENQFKEILRTADNISTDGNTLSLNKARMAPLARFELVK